MSGSGVWSFSDPHEYDRAIRAADVAGLRYAGGGRFHADLTRVDLGRVWMQRFRESAPKADAGGELHPVQEHHPLSHARRRRRAAPARL